MTMLIHAVRGFGTRFRRLDRVWLVTAAVFVALLVFRPEQAGRSFVFAVDSFVWILPFLLISVVMAAWLKAAGADGLIALAVSRRPVAAILIATAAGAFSPFCSCGVVPLVAALLAAGVPLSAVMAFWLASPIMDPEMFLLMAAQLPLDFTVAKVAAALAIGAFAGFATLGLEGLGYLKAPLKRQAAAGCGAKCRDGGFASKPLRWRFWREEGRREDFAREAGNVALFLTKWLVLAFVLESLMVAWLPGDLVAQVLGGAGWSAVPISVLVGVPEQSNAEVRVVEHEPAEVAPPARHGRRG